MIRLLHTADWQIGKPFGGFDEERRAGLRAARFEAVGRIAALAATRGVDAVLVAGDAFDDNTVQERDLNRVLDAMAAYEGPWILLPGNHDAATTGSVWDRLRPLALRRGVANLVIADEPAPIALAGGRLVVLPAPLRRRHEGADLTAWFDAAETPAAALRVGLAHGALENRLPQGADAGNPIAETRAASARLDYLALGDWHGFVEIAPKTVYAGTPEPDRYPANEPGHVALVELDGPGEPPRIERVAVARYAWTVRTERIDGDAGGLEAVFAAFPDPGHTLLRLVLSGSLPLRQRVELEAAIGHWRERFFHLDLRDEDLYDEPDEDDLDRIDVSGFVRSAIETLRAKAADPADPEREAARLAIRMAYVEHRRLTPSEG
ncbi:metallophosphoesterase family protein [Jiella sonneratiae]|uniref:DNA repair exonuclease n=1 Tax=Jiella sonneratiae TaxID=2816856 RepID=A0ABS3J4K1_9HYPH|nr:DNA repair exonuclease [Jiella sonneratiae]MBO0904610.1 DNA repair exonuclease [Jiella sonneratiae]